MHIHLDTVGGISGDMFAGALLDLDASLIPCVEGIPAALGLAEEARLRCEPRSDGVLAGAGLAVDLSKTEPGHAHTHHAAIRDLIDASALSDPVKIRAQAIFALLARAEARVHGIDADLVAFHEVGALDSIMDIAAAAVLIDATGVTSWSVSPVPVGSGRIDSQHGILPLPAPATLLLLNGLAVHDDGIPGERVTPTGAAILAHLRPSTGWPPGALRLEGSGMGVGTRRLDGVPNILRVMAMRAHERPVAEQVLELAFEIDDQSPEDLAAGLDWIRHVAGVIDVMTLPATGKKGRQGFAVRVLCDPSREADATEACFTQTTTLGIRRQLVERHVLSRQQLMIGETGVKVAHRPSGLTAKAEIDDLNRSATGHANRTRLAADTCGEALKHAGEDL